MFHFRYDIIASFQIRHEYYSEGKSTDFQFFVTRDCQSILEQLNLIFRQKNGVGYLLIKKEKKDDTWQAFLPLDKPIKLTFNIQLNNPLFHKYTLPEDIKKFYFTNLNDDGTLKTVLHQEGYVSIADKCPTLTPLQFSIPLLPDKYSQASLYTFLPIEGKTAIRTVKIDKNAESLSFQLQEEGKFMLELDKKDGTNADLIQLYCKNNVVQDNSFGIIDYYLMPDIQHNREDLTIQFNHKATVWRYFLIDKKNSFKDFGNDEHAQLPLKMEYSLSSGSKLPQGISFSQISYEDASPQEKGMIDFVKNSQGKYINNTYLFISNQAIPFLENDVPTITLLQDNSNKRLIEKLPIPNDELFNPTIFFNI